MGNSDVRNQIRKLESKINKRIAELEAKYDTIEPESKVLKDAEDQGISKNSLWSVLFFTFVSVFLVYAVYIFVLLCFLPRIETKTIGFFVIVIAPIVEFGFCWLWWRYLGKKSLIQEVSLYEPYIKWLTDCIAVLAIIGAVYKSYGFDISEKILVLFTNETGILGIPYIFLLSRCGIGLCVLIEKHKRT